jgi:hypothetical protein
MGTASYVAKRLGLSATRGAKRMMLGLLRLALVNDRPLITELNE